MCINGTRTGPSQAFQKGLDFTERICAGQAALTFVSLSVKYLSWRLPVLSYIRELKQRRRQRPRKRYLKREFALSQTLPRLFHLV